MRLIGKRNRHWSEQRFQFGFAQRFGLAAVTSFAGLLDCAERIQQFGSVIALACELNESTQILLGFDARQIAPFPRTAEVY